MSWRRRSSAGRASWAWKRSSSRPTPRASSSSTCTGCPSWPTRRSSTPAPGPTTAARSPTRSTSPACRRSRSTSPTSSRATTGAGSRSSTAWCWRRSRGKGPDGYREALELLAGELGVERGLMQRPRRPPRGAGRRARARPLPGHRPRQRPLPDRLRRHQRRLRLRRRGARLPHRLPLHRARRGRGRGLGRGHGQGRLAGRDRRAARRQDRLRRPPHVGPPAGEAGGETRPRASRWRRRAGRSRSCAGSRTRPSWRRSPPPPSWPTRSGAGALERGLAGRTELDVARAAEARMRELGAEPSFPTIVAAGPNGALPHAEPGEREIGRGELVVFDMGAKLDGYCSDGTRTFATGEPGERRPRGLRDRARGAGGGAGRGRGRRRGPRTSTRVARELIAAAGHGERFGHGLGHGVGLEVHEEPRVSQRSEDVLAAGEVVTIEPGHLPAGRARRADRGPGRRHRRRPPQPQRPAQGAAARRLAEAPRMQF